MIRYFVLFLVVILGNCQEDDSVGKVVWSCDFERDFCGLVNIPNGNEWRRRIIKGVGLEDIPQRNGATGTFVLFRPMNQSQSVLEPAFSYASTQTLSGVSPTNPDGSFCFSYWLYMVSDKENEFLIVVTSHDSAGESTVLVERLIGDAAPVWKMLTVYFTMKTDFKLQLALVVIPESVSSSSVIALDDMVLQQGYCGVVGWKSDSINCNFEQGLCGYKNSGLAKWIRTSFSNASLNVNFGQVEYPIPEMDSTLHSPDGQYMTVVLSSDAGTGLGGATLRSVQEQVVGVQCLSFHYYLVSGDSTSPITFTVSSIHDSANKAALWSSTISHGNKWIALETTVDAPAQNQSPVSLEVEFEVISGAGSAFGIVALDDITMRSGACSSKGDCGFSIAEGYCQWLPLQESPFNMIWTVQSNNSVSPSDGFAFFKGGRGSGNWIKSKALLVSELLSYDEAKCLTFDFFVGAPGPAQLSVHQVRNFDDKNPVWKHHGQLTQGEPSAANGWRFARVPLESRDFKEFLVTVEGQIIREVSYQYLVGVRDVRFLRDPCSLVPLSARPTAYLEPPEALATALCNFDNDQLNPDCGFVGDDEAPLQWHLRAGLTDDEHTYDAPEFDHTTQEIIGRFWYHILDRFDDGLLNVFSRINDTDTLLWTTKNIRNVPQWDWTLGVANEPPVGETFQIIFEAKNIMDQPFFSVAIDDISVQPTECKPLDCDFEEGMCSWENMYDPINQEPADLSWEYATSDMLPGMADFAVNRGLFLHVPVQATMVSGQRALLEHREILPADRKACLTFDYLVTSRDAGTLSVSFFNGPSPALNDELWNSHSSRGVGSWQTGQVPIIADRPWTIVFLAVSNPNNATLSDELHAIAIDNLRHIPLTEGNACVRRPTDDMNPPSPTSSAVSLYSNNSVIQSCNFNDNCGFVMQSSGITWQIRDLEAVHGNFRIPERPEGGEGNHVLFADLQNIESMMQYGYITSPMVEAGASIGGDYCLRFWLFMYTSNANKLSVSRRTISLSQTRILHEFTGAAATEWTLVNTVFHSVEAFQIVFTVEVGIEYSVYEAVVVDDYILEAGTCSVGDSALIKRCDFEASECGYTASGATNYMFWSRTSYDDVLDKNPIEGLSHIAPEVDNTYQSPGGHYAFIDVTNTTSMPDGSHESFYTSSTYEYSNDACISFFYRSIRTTPLGPTLLLDAISQGTVRKLWSSNVAHGKKWIAVKETLFKAWLPDSYDLAVRFGLRTSKSERGAVAVDDATVMPGSCVKPGDCSFPSGSNGLCSWTRLVTDSIRMQWIKGHEEGFPANGSYIYFFGGRAVGNFPRSRAILMSEDMKRLPEQQYLCMTFNYFTNASGAAVIRVHLVQDPSDYNPLWETYGREPPATLLNGTIWHHAQIPVPQVPNGEDFLITIEGAILREVDVIYLIAIDDIVFVDQDCTLTPGGAQPLPTISPPTEDNLVEVCTFDESSGSVDDRMCGWQNDPTASAQWQLLTGFDGRVLRDPNVPQFDHSTLESFGKFIYFNCTNLPVGAVARIISTEYRPVEPQCIRFWYHAAGNNLGELHLLTLANNSTIMVDTVNVENDGYWYHSSVAAPKNLPNFSLVFEGHAASGNGSGGIAIDEVAVIPGECQIIGRMKYTPCPVERLTARSQIKHCIAGLPGVWNCTFEHGMCGWENFYHTEDSVELDWIYGSASVLQSANDSINRGIVLYVPVRNDTRPGATAFVRQDSWVWGVQNYCLQFEYLLTDPQVGALSIWYYFVDSTTGETYYQEVWMDDKDADGQWQRGQIFLKHTGWWLLMIQMTAGNLSYINTDSMRGIALDNIKHEVVLDAYHCPTLPRTGSDFLTTVPEVATTVSLPNGNREVYGCDFDFDLCHFALLHQSTVLWRRTDIQGTDGVVPARLPGAGLGDKFMYADLKNNDNVVKYGSIASPAVASGDSVSGDYCLRLWIFMESHGDTKVKLKWQEYPGGVETLLEQFVGDARPTWTAESIPFNTMKSFQVMFTAEVGREARAAGAVAVDEYSLEAGKCSAAEPSRPGFFCDFEKSDCGYTSSGDVSFVNWTRTSRLDIPPTSDFTLMEMMPVEDNTFSVGKGHYAFAYLGPKTDGYTGVKRSYYDSPEYSLTADNNCVSFFYRNHKLPNKPRTKLTLNYKAKAITKELWNSNAERGKIWIAVKRTVSTLASSKNISLQFGVNVEKGAKGGIAVDDIAITPGVCDRPGDCTFNTGKVGLCEWKQVISESIKMQWINRMPTTGPLASSAYIFFEGGRGSGNFRRYRALLQSEDLLYSTPQALCMTFNFFMNSSGAAVVRIHQVQTAMEYNSLWENRGYDMTDVSADGNVWHHAQIPIPVLNNTDDFLITIEGEILREVDVRYFMAIDEVVFLEQSCPLVPGSSIPLPTVTPSTDYYPNLCTFDQDSMLERMCGWTNSPDAVLQWEVKTADENAVHPELPPFDHTTLEPFGKYLYLNGSGKEVGAFGHIISTGYSRNSANEPRCLHFWYHLKAQNHMTLDVYAGEDNDAQNIYGMRGWNSDRWYLVKRSVPDGLLDFKLHFVGTISASVAADGGIALDDITVTPDNCQQIDCNFEHGMCDWENYYDGSWNLLLDWTYGTSEILQSQDDSINRGIFLYVPITNYTPPHDLAYLRLDPLIQGGNDYCFHFEYLATAPDIGLMTIWLYWLTESNVFTYAPVWQSNGEPNIGKWQTGQIFVNRTESWTLMIEVLVNESSNSLPGGIHGIAIDDLRNEVVTDANHCPLIPEQAAPPTVPPPSTTLVATPIPGSFENFQCDFDDGSFCRWTQRSQDDYKWKVGTKGSTVDGGPLLGDHSKDHLGYYIYLDAATGSRGNKARIFSPSLDDTSEYCVRFYYNMNGEEMGQLNLFYVREGTAFSTTWTPPFSLKTGRSYGNQWIGAAYTVAKFNVSKQIVLEAVRGNSSTSYIAVDDIRATKGRCETAGSCSFDNTWCKYNPYLPESRGVWSNSVNMASIAVTDVLTPTTPAILRGEMLNAKENYCLTFQYFVYRDVELVVKSIQYSGDMRQEPQIVWRYAGGETVRPVAFVSARTWIYGTNPLQISFEVYSSGNIEADAAAAIRDVYLVTKSQSACSNLPAEAVPNPTGIPTLTTVDFTVVTILPVTEPSALTPLSQYNCNFDNNTFCEWTSTGPVKWALARTQVHPQSGPTSDLNGYGYFAYFNPISSIFSTLGRLTSPYIQWPDDNKPSYYIFSFWYYMHGAGIDALHVRTQRRTDTGWNTLWSVSGDRGKRWISEELILPSKGQEFKVALEGLRKISYTAIDTSYIAVDEIVFGSANSPSEFQNNASCDFETEDICGYDGTFSTEHRWVRRSGNDSRSLNDTGPFKDKSQDSEEGHYMAFDPKGGNVGDFSRLISNYHKLTTEACVRFFYYRRTRKTFPGLLTIWWEENGEMSDVAVWSDTAAIGGDFWEPVSIQIEDPFAAWSIVFHGTVVSSFQPIIAIDQVTVTDGLCPRNLLYCGFDEDVCNWSNDIVGDHINWVIESGQEEDLTGPKTDALGDVQGSYMLFEAYQAQTGETARLISTPISNKVSNVTCFKFYYFMYGRDMGDLSVIQRNLESDQDTVIWMQSGVSINQWLLGRVRVAGDFPYQIILEAKRGESGLLGNIALDELDEDVTSSCSVQPAGADIIPSTTLAPATTEEAHTTNCTFEFDVCLWKVENTTIQWRRIRADYTFVGTGPKQDHTINSQYGHYMIFDATQADANGSAELSSSFLGGPRCVQFYFHAAGRHVGHLNVLKAFSNGTREVSWTRESPDEGRIWQFAEVEFEDSVDFQIIFQAVKGSGTQGNIALDDITLLNHLCHQDGDGVCTFEHGLCGFTTGPNPEAMMWQRVMAPQPLSGNSWPSYDMSTGTERGHYLVAYRPVSANSSISQILSPLYSRPPFPSFETQLCFKFYYHFQAQGDTLTIKLIQEDTERLLDFLEGDHGYSWNFATYKIANNGSFNVLFEAFLNNTWTYVALDDVSFSSGNCSHRLDCSFGSENFCWWHNVDATDGANYDELNWEATSVIGLTGPVTDAGSGTRGYFALVSGEPPAKYGDSAWLVSPEVAVNHYVCLSFWYNMDTRGSGVVSTLRLLTIDFSDRSKEKLWIMETGEGGIWKRGHAGSTKYSPRNLIFEAELGNNPKAYVAIDEILVLDGLCDPAIFPSEASPNYVPPASTLPPGPVDIEFRCTFDDGDLCGWENDASNAQNCTWVIRSGPSVTLNTGPSVDHNLQNSEGGYLYHQSRPCGADLASTTTITKTRPITGYREREQCFSFWYFMYGAPRGLQLTVTFENDPTPILEFMRGGNQGKQWLHAEVTIEPPSNTSYKLGFAVYGDEYTRFGDIALDDFHFQDGACQSSTGLCDFEGKGFCGFQGVKQAGSTFAWNHGRDDAFAGLPDHTFSSVLGSVAYAKGVGVPKGVRAYIVSRMHTYSEGTGQCVTFWYLLPSTNAGRLSVHLLRGPSGIDFTSPDWSAGGNGNPDLVEWEYGTVPVTLYDNFRFAFEAENDKDSLFLLDDIVVMNEECPKPLSCDFENNGASAMCGWTNQVTGALDQFNWILFSGDSSPGDNAGPSSDHTEGVTGLGHYIYIDNEYPNPMKDHEAHLISQRVFAVQAEGNEWCFSFWYQMYIDSRSNASLELLVQTFGETEDQLFWRNQPARNMWYSVRVNISDAGDFRLKFVGKVAGAHGKSDIALDDFAAVKGSCSSEVKPMFQCLNGTTISRERVCDYRVDCSDDEQNCGSCNFDSVSDRMCGYTPFQNNEFIWAPLNAGDTGARYPNPLSGAEGTPGYMNADLNNGPDRSVTYLDSPWIHDTFSTCKLTFWAYIDAVAGDPGAILVTIEMEDTDTIIAILDKNMLAPSQTPAWNKFTVGVGRHSGEFRFVFRARKGYVEKGSLAVDQINLLDCSFPVAVSACEAGKWQCPLSKACINPVEKRCDFTDDCGYFDDERECAELYPNRCNFDEGFCDWTQSTDDSYDWTWSNKRSSTAYSGPLRDHTVGLQTGAFIYVKSTTAEASQNKVARLRSRTFTVTPSAVCVLRIFYHMYGKNMGTFRIFLDNGRAVTQQLFRTDGDHGDLWQNQIVSIPSGANMRIVLEVTLGGPASDIAVDDVSFSAGCSGGLDIPTTTLPTLPPTTARPTTTAMPTPAPTSPLVSTVDPKTTQNPSTAALTTNAPTISVTSALTTPSPASSTPIPPTQSSDVSTSAPQTTPLLCASRWCAPEQKCILASQICDGIPDCTDGSDEKNCSPSKVAAGGLDGGAISGIVIGVLLGVAGLVVVSYFVVMKIRQRRGVVDRRTTTNYASFGALALDGMTDETDTDGDFTGNRVLHDLFSKDL